jgi:Helix-turn-helix domain
MPVPRYDPAASPLCTSREVADAFRVDPKTVATWAATGRLGPVTRTLGGHLRFDRAHIAALLRGEQAGPPGQRTDQSAGAGAHHETSAGGGVRI